MSKSFFITRQTASLMEDFVRDLKAEMGLYLIYGDSGVGKTRLLEELMQTHFAQSKIRWMDLQAGSSGAGVLVDSSVMIEETFALSRPGDIIVADHFEMALRKTRHQLFLSWSAEGIDKKLNMIVVSNIDYFNDLRQLAQQYQTRIQSFQLMPFSTDEVSSFLAFYLFPDRPGAKLSVPPLLQDQLAMAQGSVGKIIDIAERAGDQMISKTKVETESELESELESETGPKRHGSRIVAGVLATVAIVVGVGWYLVDGQTGMDWKTFAEPDSPQINQLVSLQTVPSEPADSSYSETYSTISSEVSSTEVENTSVTEELSAENSEVASAAGDSEMESVTAEVDQTAGELATNTVSTPAPTPAAESEAEIVIVASTTAVDEYAGSEPTAMNAAERDEQQPEQSARETAPVTPAEVEAKKTPADSVAPPASLAGSRSDRFQRDIRTSLEWIDDRAAKVGTLQIMVLSQERFDEKAYYEFIDRLARQGVDTSQIRILETLTGSKMVFSVVYGEYQNRGAAGVAETDLPSVLQKTSPIPRSVGALKEEMRRLAGQN